MSNSIYLRLKELRTELGLSKKAFSELLKVDNSQYGKIESGNLLPTLTQVMELCSNIKSLNTEWLLSGNGLMLKESNQSTASRKLIPVYDDISYTSNETIIVASEPPAHYYKTLEYIDPGDWFPEATAAIRHHGESMSEYPSGSRLPLLEKQNLTEIIPGENYVIEWDNGDYNRTTKRLLPCQDDDNAFMAYATNKETYIDGTPKFPPFKIQKSDIRRLFLVLGCVLKHHSGTIVLSTSQKETK